MIIIIIIIISHMMTIYYQVSTVYLDSEVILQLEFTFTSSFVQCDVSFTDACSFRKQVPT